MSRNFFKLYLESRYNITVRDDFEVEDFFEEETYLAIDELSCFLDPDNEGMNRLGLYFLNIYIWISLFRFLIELRSKLMLGLDNNSDLNSISVPNNSDSNSLSFQIPMKNDDIQMKVFRKNKKEVKEAIVELENYEISRWEKIKWALSFISNDDINKKMDGRNSKKIGMLEEKLAYAMHYNKQVAMENEKYKSENNELLQKIMYMQKENRDQQIALFDDIEILKKKIREKDLTIDRFQRNIKQLAAKYKEALKTIDHQERIILALNTQVQKLQNTVNEQNKKIEEQDNKMFEQDKQIVDQGKTIFKQSIQICELKEENKQQKVVIGTLQDKVEVLTKDVSTLNGTISGLHGTISGLNGTISGLNVTISDLKDESKLGRDTMKDLCERLANLEKKNKEEPANKDKQPDSSYKLGFYSK